jgi:hypothetical protein
MIAVIPALDEEERVGDTVRAVRSVEGIDDVVVVDGGSRDDTAVVASNAGARVLVSPRRLGKGQALEVGLEHAGPADAYVLLDADLGTTSARLGPLLREVVSGRADMVVAVMPAPPTGGFGLVRRLSAALIGVLTGMRPRAPLSGQRAITARCLSACRPLAGGFGVEVGLTVDAARLGFAVREVEVPLEHRFTHRDLPGFAHRARQGIDALGAAGPRLLRLR